MDPDRLFWQRPRRFIVASYAALATERIGLMLAQSPGFVAPTLAAHKLATLDHFSGGRSRVHIIAGGDDAEQAEGWKLPGPSRTLRAHRRVCFGILSASGQAQRRLIMTAPYYWFRSAYSEVKPLSRTCQSISAVLRTRHQRRWPACGRLRAMGRAADQAAETIAKVRASAARYQRSVRFSVSAPVRILAPTEAQAWKRADHIRETIPP